MNNQQARSLGGDNDEFEAANSDFLSIHDLERFWQQAINLRYVILGIIVLSLVVGLIVTLLHTPLYRSTARIEISQIESDATNIGDVQLQNIAGDRLYFATQYELLQSRSLADRVVSAGNLNRDENFQNTFGLAEKGVSDSTIANILLANVSVDPIPNSNLVDIKFSSPDPRLSAEIANLWAQEFLGTNFDKRFGSNVEAQKFLADQISEMREKLQLSEQELIDYANANEIVNITPIATEEGSTGGGQTLASSILSALSGDLARATAARIEAESALRANAVAANSTSASAVLKSRLSEVQAKLASLKSQFGPSYPQIVALAAEEASLRSSMQAASNDISVELQANLRKALLQEQALQREFDRAKSGYLGQQGQGVRYGILKREVDTNRQLYDALLQRYKEIGVVGAGKNNMSLVDKAEVPKQPYEPSLSRNLLLAFLFGALGSGGLVFLRETLDQSIRNPADVKRVLDLPVLGLIPLIPADDIQAELGDKKSELNEAYQATRTNLTFLTDNGAPATLMFTSTRPDEGKTLTTIAVAESLGHLGKRVLYIDADLRNSGLHEVFNTVPNRGGGLSGFLAGSDDYQQSIVSLESHPFDILPGGRKPPNPAELLAGPRMQSLLEKLRATYDHILIDSPPVLGLADALEIAAVVDGVVFVIEANSGKIRTIQQALGRLETSGARIFGAVVTKLDDRNLSYGYGYGYGYGHSYGDNHDS
ncbi:polysaccharide biosynthesis tyrosine autokinase [Sphingorhabdus sp. YGSMI21]|uniref:GumC family protein n=1 Tax=Sphingorhabdus sp. YGSMI21 TaxID=2077182 RepID=UPI0013DA1F1A|nr:polysaccharide biosynthesis tyrosine autokinase [Sphingorhabdus sp. YGSMI21]